jgi:maspardin
MNGIRNEALTMADAVAQVRQSATKLQVESAGLVWNVLERGAGEKTLVFLPGALGTVEVFSKQIVHFSPQLRVIVLGYPGESNKSKMTDSFYRLLDTLDVKRAGFVGSSLGAYWMQVFSHECDERIDSLVLANTFVDAEPLQANPLFSRAMLEKCSANEVKERWVEFLHAMPESELKAAQLAMVIPDQTAGELKGRLTTVAHSTYVPLSRVPADKLTILTCDDDPITHGTMGEALRLAYRPAPQISLPFGGHYPHVTNAKGYNKVVTDACGVDIQTDMTFI